MRGVFGTAGLLVIAVLAVVTGASAKAAVYTATFTGTFSGAADLAGLFGPTGSSLDGQAFAATYRVDTGKPGVVDFVSLDQRYFYSGEYYGGLPRAMTATLSANGHSVALGGNYKGMIVQENGLTAAGRYGNGDQLIYVLDDYDHANKYFSLQFSIDDVTTDIFPTLSFSAPGHYHFGATTYQDNRFSFYDGGNLGYGSLLATDLVVSAAGVPEPAIWGLMLGGFALTGAALRRRPTLRVVAA